jgi:integrase/recombinase XerD
LSGTTIQKMLKVAVQKTGILKAVTPHTLRHSYATGLLEAGVDLLTISRLLGHKSFSTTMIYLHVRRTHLGLAPSPADWLPVRQLPGWMIPDANGQSEKAADDKTPQNRRETDDDCESQMC